MSRKKKPIDYPSLFAVEQPETQCQSPSASITRADVAVADTTANSATGQSSSAERASAENAGKPSDADKSPKVRTESLSPAMRQYQDFKRQHPDYVLFFRMGDFYEMFFEDATLCAKTLGITLTTRQAKGNNPDPIPMAGVPYHAVEGYLRKMIAAGHKVAICEAVENTTKRNPKREITRLASPGSTDDEIPNRESGAKVRGVRASDGSVAAAQSASGDGMGREDHNMPELRTPDEDGGREVAGTDEARQGESAEPSTGEIHSGDSEEDNAVDVGMKPRVDRIIDVRELGLAPGSVDEIRIPFLMGSEHTPTSGGGMLLHFTDNYYFVIPTSERDVYDLRTFYPEPVADTEAGDTLCNRKVILRGGGPEDERTVYVGPWSERMLVKDVGIRSSGKAAA